MIARIAHRCFSLVLLLLTSLLAPAQELVWRPAETPEIAQNLALEGHIARYYYDAAALQPVFAKASQEGNPFSGAWLSLPHPNGETIAFQLWETKLVAAEASQGVRTFTGVSANKKSKIHLTLMGNRIEGIGRSAGQHWFVTTAADGGSLTVYDGKGRPFTDAVPACNADGLQPTLPEPPATGGRTMLTPATACSLRIYRLALMGTADYTNYFGSASAAYANTIALLNNLNALYEDEMGIRFTLASTAAHMYTNAAADPFTNSGATSCNEVTVAHSELTSAVGFLNFDLGMVLYGQNFGGCAYLRSVCNGGLKGGNVGGYNVPTPSSYLLEVAMHEIGHQFGAGHTHNSNSGCTPTTSSSWEPGGGNSVMAYGTNCTPSHTKSGGQFYFHGGSLGQMRSYIATGGGGCFTSGVANTTPLLSAPTDDVFTIPISTPFRLYAVATDTADANTLSYAFEQMDLGVGSPLLPQATATTGPIVRSYEPSSEAERFIPHMDSLLQNKSSNWEALPSVARSMRFWATVRDNRAGCGCAAVDTINIATSGSAAFTVTSQASPSSFSMGASTTVQWNVAGTSAAPFNVSQVDILFAADGYHYNTVLVANTPNDGSQQVNLPNFMTTNGRIMVAARNNVFFNINRANISLQAPCANMQLSQISPDDDFSAPAGNAALLLNQQPVFGMPTDSLNGVIATTDPFGAVGGMSSATDSTCAQSISGRYDVHRFTTTKSGRYRATVERITLGAFNYMALYNSNGYVAGNACANYTKFSNNFYQNGSNYSYTFFNFDAAASTAYEVAMTNAGSSANYGSYRIRITGPGKLFTEARNTASAYGYVVVNAAGTIVWAGATNPDLRNLPAGDYQVRGLVHSNSINLANYLNQPFSQLASGSFSSGGCVALSANSRKVTVTTNLALALAHVRLQAQKADGGHLLQWTVDDDADVNGAEVEHSVDGRNFATQARLARHEGRSGAGQYKHLHRLAAGEATHYYRIKQWNARGGFVYSNVAMVQEKSKVQVVLSPNPTKGMVTLSQAAGGFVPYDLQVLDASGRQVAAFKVMQPLFTTNLSQLSPGIYLLKAQDFTLRLIRE